MSGEKWWGDFTLAQSECMGWSLGEREFWIQRLTNEWHTWDIESAGESHEELRYGHKVPDDAPDHAVQARHLQNNTSDLIQVCPRLADRSVVARPSTALRVLPGEQIRLYISTPLWFSFTVASTDTLLLDAPFYRPTDTWFGPSTREGEMCYAKYTDAKVLLNKIERRVYRAITPVNVINKNKDALVIERMSVPVPLLRLYADKQSNVWTEMITITRDINDGTSELLLTKLAPEEAKECTQIAEARIVPDKSTIIRSLSSLFA